MRATGLDQMPHVERDDDDDMHICIFGDKPITMSMTEQMRVLRIRLEQVARNPPTDLIQNFIFKVRMLQDQWNGPPFVLLILQFNVC